MSPGSAKYIGSVCLTRTKRRKGPCGRFADPAQPLSVGRLDCGAHGCSLQGAERVPLYPGLSSLCDVLCPCRMSLGLLPWERVCSSAASWQWEMDGEGDRLTLGLPSGEPEKEGREQGRWRADGTGSVREKHHSL